MCLTFQSSLSESYLNYVESRNYILHNDTIDHFKEELKKITAENVYLKASLKYHLDTTAIKTHGLEKELGVAVEQNKQLLENNISLEMELKSLKSSTCFHKMQLESIRNLNYNERRLKKENKKLLENLKCRQRILEMLKDTNVALQKEVKKQIHQNKNLIGVNETLEIQIKNLKNQVGSLLKIMKTDANTDLTMDDLLMELKPNCNTVKTFKITKQYSSKVSVVKLEDIAEDQ